MSIALRATTHLTTLSRRYRLKAPKTYFAPKKQNLRIKSQPYHVTMRWSHLKKTTKRIRRRGSGVKSENILRSGKSKLRLPASTPPMSWRKRRRGVTLVRSRVLIVMRKATLPATVPSQKTSISFGNLCADYW